MTSVAGALGTVDADVFLELVNEVLLTVRRQPLAASGPEQRAIVVRPDDQVLQILAGPGSGKTEMLVWRVLYDVMVLATESQRVMVTTFTRRAATELQVRLVERVDAIMGAARKRGIALSDPKVHDLRVGTIHSLCDSLLAEFDSNYNESGIAIADEAEVFIRLARDHRNELGYWNPPRPQRVLNRLLGNPALTALFRPPWDNDGSWPSSLMERVSCISAMLNQHTETWVPRCAAAGRHNGIEIVHGPAGVTDDLVKVQERWESYLTKNHIVDFATIQKRFLQSQDLVARNLSHVFVDEFQDNNPVQFALHTGWLRTPGIRLTVVGDDDQAIYRFRGSDIECFNQLAPSCRDQGVGYRLERLETNHRSTKAIVSFTQRFKSATVLASLSMPKKIESAEGALTGSPVRLLEGPWDKICEIVGDELRALQAGMPAELDASTPPTAAVLMFSSSERSYRDRSAPALVLRSAIEGRGIRIYNPRDKTAALRDSPIAQLLGLISYLIDPITYAPVGKGNRPIMVAASTGHLEALAVPPNYPINRDHLTFQKWFLKADGGDIGAPSATRSPVVEFLDKVRASLALECRAGRRPRLTLAGLVARLLTLPFFRDCGFTPRLFREALFTELLESHVASTRLTTDSLDQPLEVIVKKKKYVWPKRYWDFLGVFGAFLNNAALDDPEVESFEEGAVLLLTFHQAKGLEFDHVYVAATGRPPDLGPALRTKLFSGEAPKYRADPKLTTRDRTILDLALADRDREVYVALTRAKRRLTILHDPDLTASYMALNQAIDSLFKPIRGAKHPVHQSVLVREHPVDE